MDRDIYNSSNVLTVQGLVALADGATLDVAGLDIVGGGTLTGGGTLVGPIRNDGVIIGSLGYSNGFSTSGDLVVQSPVTGTGSLVVAAGTTYPSGLRNSLSVTATLEITGATAENVIIADNTGTLVLDHPETFGGTIVPAKGTGTIVLPGISLSAITGHSFSGNSDNGTLTINEAGTTIPLHFAGNFNAAGFIFAAGALQFSNSPPSVVITAAVIPCFAAGSRIATSLGMVAVERLKAGDVVLTGSGGRQIIQWIGRRTVVCRTHPRQERVWPVRIAPHAFGEGRPDRPLFLSPDHSVFMEGVLIPIRFLINDLTIVQREVDSVTYFHVELERHDILLADGLPTESYLETGGRSAFENAGAATQFHPNFEPDPDRVATVWRNLACAPLLGQNGQFERVRTQVLWQASMLGEAASKRTRRRLSAA
jgi:Hint domain